jgi:hypothetical protein
MRDNSTGSGYTVEEHEGTWFQLWWDGQECIYSEDLQSKTREDAEREAVAASLNSRPLERVMEAMGCVSERPKERAKG